MATVAKGKVIGYGIGSSDGHTYNIYLDNGAPTAAGTDLSIRSASVSWKSDTNDIDSNLLTSKATVTFTVSNSTEAAFFVSMTDANELQYRLRIEKNGSLWWVGFVLVDLVVESFSGYPKTFTVAATDGISRTKTIDYQQNSLDEFSTVREHLFNVLSYVPLDDYFSASEEYLKAHSTMVPEGMTAGVNVFEKLRLNFKALRTVDKTGEIKYYSVYDALLEILKAFNLRLVFSNGRYVISEIADYARQLEDVVFYRYDIDGTELSSETLTSWAGHIEQIGATLSSSDAVARAGGEITHLPPLREVDLVYKHYSRQNLLPGYTWTESSNPSASVENVGTNGGAGRFLLSGNLSFRVTDAGSAENPAGNIFLVFAAHITVQIPGGSGKSLKRTATITAGGVSYTTPEWVNPGARYEFAIPAAPPIAAALLTANLQTLTPVIPNAGTLTLTFSQVSYVDRNGSAISGVTITYDVANVYLESLLTGSIADQYNFTRFPSLGAGSGDNSVVLPRELIFGDGPGDNTFGRIEYTENDTDWLVANTWRRYADGAYLHTNAMAHGDLVSKMTLALQEARREQLDITVVAPDYEPDFMFGCDSKLYLMQSGTLDLSNDQWRGRWIESAINFYDTTTTGVTTVDNPGVITGDGGGVGEPITEPFTPVGNPSTGDSPGNTAPAINTVVTTTGDEILITDGEIGNISINNISDVPLFAGDTITLTNPDTGQTEDFVLAYDSGYIVGSMGDAGAIEYYTDSGVVYLVPSTTQVAIVAQTPTVDFPEDSYVQPNAQSQAQIQEVVRVAHETANVFGFTESLTVSAAGADGWFWRPELRQGDHIRKVHFAFGTNASDTTTKVNLKYYDATGYRYTIATYNSDGLGGVVDAFADILEGYYLIEVETINAPSPQGLTVTIEYVKTRN